MPVTFQRLYRGTDTEMLLAISTIMTSAVSYQDELVPKHKIWKPPFFTTLQGDIQSVLQKWVGVDSDAALRKATSSLIGLQQTAFSNLANIRTSINAGFLTNKDRREELLRDLGYYTYNDAARRHDKEDAH